MNVLTKLKGIKVPNGTVQAGLWIAELAVGVGGAILKEKQEKEKITKIVEEILEAKGLNK